jgi:hypothetical protein
MGMFLRSYKRRKNGKWHEYFSVVENRRLAGGKRVQRTVAYLGEISGSQEDAWRQTLQVFDQDAGKTFTKSLFADDGEITNHAIDSIKVKLSQMQLCGPRSFGSCGRAVNYGEGWALMNSGPNASAFHIRIPTADGRMLEMRRYSQPEIENPIILEKLKIDLPAQPPPKVYSHQLNSKVCGGN